MKKLVLVVVLALVALVLVAGCEVEFYAYVWEEAPPSAVTETGPMAGLQQQATRQASAEERWSRRVQEECARRDAKASALARPGSLDELGRYAEELLALYSGTNDRIAKLRPPKAYAAEARHLERLARDVEAALERLAASAQRGDSTAALAGARDVRALANRANPTLLALDLGDCLLTRSSAL